MADLIDREATLAAIEQRARDEVADVNHYYLMGFQDAAETVENMPKAELATDLISRQAAIDIERRATVDTNPEHFESHQKFVEFMDNAEISSFGRWQWSNGFNTALTAVGIDLERLPTAQPEIIQCRECVYGKQDDDGYWSCGDLGFVMGDLDGSGFCSNAERRPDGLN